jgi:AbiV family abortive infection protein
MPDEEHLNELAQNVRDLIAEAELLFENRHWARAAGLAIYAGEEAIKFDFIKNHPENTPDSHESRGGVWNQHDQNAYVSAASQNVFIPPEIYFADIPGRAQLEAKAARGDLYR